MLIDVKLAEDVNIYIILNMKVLYISICYAINMVGA